MNDMEVGMGTQIAKAALDFQASMTSSIINGSLSGGDSELDQVLRSAAMAEQGIGTNIDVAV